MVRMLAERLLVIGDTQRQLQSALVQAVPGAQVTAVGNYFDAIAELSAGEFTAVLASAEPIERRPEAAVRTLRSLAANARLVLFGHPTLEPLSRKMLEFGCDDYVVTPTNPAELAQVFASPQKVRVSPPIAEAAPSAPAAAPSEHPLLAGLPLAEIVLGALVDHPQQPAGAAVKKLNELLAPAMQLIYLPKGAQQTSPADGRVVVSAGVRIEAQEVGQLHLLLPREQDANAGRHFVSHLADLMSKLQSLQDRHNRLQKLAITDELTGLYNARYFRHGLGRILEKAHNLMFPVTLLIFDIDNFKKYNDEFGHGAGDEILKQTAALLKRTCREHDLVARLGGDEFAIVFWDPEGPRKPRDPASTPLPGRPPQTPEAIFERFRKQLASHDLPSLGPSGKGSLTISAGLAVYPYQATTIDELVELADKRLMFGAKRAGKNSLFLVGEKAQGERK